MTEVTSENEIIEQVQTEAKADDERKWCVYCHTNKSNGKKYIGITSQKPEDRWRNGRGYQTSLVFWRAINKYTWDGFEHEIVAHNLTEKEAKNKEMELIAFYKTNCYKYQNPSYGYNLTDGGDGVSGIKPWNYGIPMSDEQKEMIRKAHFGKPLSEDHKKKLSDIKKGKPPNNAGRPMSETAKKHLSESLRGHPVSDELKLKLSNLKKGKYTGIDSSRFRPVYNIELNEIFWGAKEVKLKYGFEPSNIGSCCRGERNYAYRHPETDIPLHWLYAEDAIMQAYITQQDLDNYLNNLKTKGD